MLKNWFYLEGEKMQPIYNELIEMWKAKGVVLPLIEGFYWLDKSIVKCFDKQGNLHKLYRIYISDNLSITYKEYPQMKEIQIESWMDTAMRIKPVFHFLELVLSHSTIYIHLIKFIFTNYFYEQQ